MCAFHGIKLNAKECTAESHRFATLSILRKLTSSIGMIGRGDSYGKE